MDNVHEKLVKLIGDYEWYMPLEELAEHLIANGVTLQKWFTVSEPPKENGRYYVHVKMHDISYVKIVSFSLESIAGLHDNVWYEYDSDVGFYEVRDVTHWMPLPQPPKEE